MNLAGEIVGINTAALRGGRVEGIGFAVGGETAIHVSNQLIEWGRVQWPWLGVVISELDAETAAEMKIPFSGGIIIRSVVSDGPAETGGLRADDIILSMDDAPTAGIRDFVQLLRLRFAVNQNVDVEVWRMGRWAAIRLASESAQLVLYSQPTRRTPNVSSIPPTCGIRRGHPPPALPS